MDDWANQKNDRDSINLLTAVCNKIYFYMIVRDMKNFGLWESSGPTALVSGKLLYHFLNVYAFQIPTETKSQIP